MSAAIEYDAACETWNDVERLVYFAVWKFYRTYHWGDLEELFSIARYEFVTARPEYDPERNDSFEAYIYFKVWKRLLETMRETMRTGRRYRDAVDTEDVEIPERQRADDFNLDVFLSELPRQLSEEAQALLRIVLEAPQDVVLALNCRIRDLPETKQQDIVVGRHQTKKASRRHVQAAFREYLTDLGWTRRTITDTFAEIGRALQPPKRAKFVPSKSPASWQLFFKFQEHKK